MSKLSRIFVITLLTALSSAPALAANEVTELGAATPAPQADAASPWPVQVTGNGRTFLIYQPQVDKWQNNRLEGRSAVAVRDNGGQQNFGVIYFSAPTELDARSGTVTVHDAAISKADFPALSAGAGDYLSMLRTQFAARSWQVAADRLRSDMEIDKLTAQPARQALNNDPPRILYSDRPAVLVPIDGDPVLRPVAETGLMRVTNTRALMLQDTVTSRYYLFVSDRWMTSPGLTGPWSVAANPSAQLETAKQIATQQDQVDLLQAASADGSAMPANVDVFVSTTPSELVQTDGPPQYSPIERTQLLYVTNSPNQLFLDLNTQNHYALISGRWYRTPALAQSQWSYVPATSLPADFAMIPADHPTQSVRAAVPGTPQAREAVIQNAIPQVATVTRSATSLDVAYDGSPVFQPIAGTSLQNAVNAPVPVIRVGEDAFYALDNGVWFVASSPFGPWTVTSYVPSVIYSIPPNSPLYYVTYVRVYDATPEVVYVGYTPGYVGSYVSSDDVVVYGTGWRYRPWIGSVWYGAPVTWGFGFSYAYTWWHPVPWYAWRRATWVSPPCYRPWWGPWRAPMYGRAQGGGYVVGAVNAIRPAQHGLHDVNRIYDRWDRKSVAWSAPSHGQRSFTPEYVRPKPGSGFVAGPDGRRRDIGGDRSRDWRDAKAPRFDRQDDRREARPGQPRSQPPASAGNERTPADNRPIRARDRGFDRPQADNAAPASPKAQALPPVQTPWRRAPRIDRQDDRRQTQAARPQGQPPVAAGNERTPADNRSYRARERGFERPQADNAAPRVRVDNGSGNERQRQFANPQRPVQTERVVQIAREAPQPRTAPPVVREAQQPRAAPPVMNRTERAAAANPGRPPEREAGRAQFQRDGGHGGSNSGGGRGRERGGEDHR